MQFNTPITNDLVLTRSPVLFNIYDAAYLGVDFRYRLKVYIWHGAIASPPSSAEFLLQKPNNPNGSGTFNVAPLLQSYLESIEPARSGTTSTYGQAVFFRLGAGYRDSSGTYDDMIYSDIYLATDGYGDPARGLNNARENWHLFLTDQPGAGVYLTTAQRYTLQVQYNAPNPIVSMQFETETGAGYTHDLTWQSTPPGLAQEYLYLQDVSYAFVNGVIGLTPLVYYKIRGLDAATNPLTDWYFFYLIDACKYDDMQLSFLNAYGCQDYLPVTLKNAKTTTRESDSYAAANLVESAVAMVLDTAKHTQKPFNVKGHSKLVLNTPHLKEGSDAQVEQLLLSEYVWLHQPGKGLNPVPVNVEMTSQMFKQGVNEKLIQYTLNVRHAHDALINIV